ncbi:MAG TPA: OsmC family protein [Thermoplasmata archaeon]|nr:OsmC family protein [Thermoplasmata archaeon]
MRRKLARYAEMDRQRNVSKLQLAVEKGDDQISVASVPGTPFSWSSEERGPSPLAYFLSSLAMCQCVHYAEHAAAEGVRIDSLRFDVEGTYVISHPRSFEEIVYTVRIESPEDPSKIRKLFETAADDCYVTGTLRKACRVTGHLVLNGVEQ